MLKIAGVRKNWFATQIGSYDYDEVILVNPTGVVFSHKVWAVVSNFAKHLE